MSGQNSNLNNEKRVDEEILAEENKTSQNAKEKKLNVFERTIKKYLDNFAESDPLFHTKYKASKKTISDCCNYIANEVKNMKRTIFEDEEIFNLAIHFYEEGIEGTKDKVNYECKVSKPVLSEEEKVKVKQEAKAELDRQKKELLKQEKENEIRRLKEIEEKEKAKEEEHKKKVIQKEKAKVKAKEDAGYVSLFDFAD